MSASQNRTNNQQSGNATASIDTSCPAAAALRQRGLLRVHCEVVDGTIVLSGRVRTYYLKQLAQEVVKKADTVNQVINRVDVEYT